MLRFLGWVFGRRDRCRPTRALRWRPEDPAGSDGRLPVWVRALHWRTLPALHGTTGIDRRVTGLRNDWGRNCPRTKRARQPLRCVKPPPSTRRAHRVSTFYRGAFTLPILTVAGPRTPQLPSQPRITSTRKTMHGFRRVCSFLLRSQRFFEKLASWQRCGHFGE